MSKVAYSYTPQHIVTKGCICSQNLRGHQRLSQHLVYILHRHQHLVTYACIYYVPQTCIDTNTLSQKPCIVTKTCSVTDALCTLPNLYAHQMGNGKAVKHLQSILLD